MAASARTWENTDLNSVHTIKAIRCEQEYGKINTKRMVIDSQVLLYHTHLSLAACGFAPCNIYQDESPGGETCFYP